MSSNALIYDLILETKQATLATQKMVADSKSQAGQAGTQAGNQFAKNFQNALGGIAFGAIFNQIKNGVLGATSAYKAYEKANTNLSGAIRAVNQREQEKIAVLNDSNASIEQKALAIGMDTADIYENTKATQSNAQAIKNAEAEINKQTRAFEDASSAIEANVKALEEKQSLEIQAIRNARGYGTLTAEQQKQEEELLALNLESLQAQKAGDLFTVALLKNQIDSKKLDQNITENKIKQIDEQTDKVKDLYQVQIQALRVELQASKNKFDIDIEPAKRKLEDFRASSESVGGGQVLKKGITDLIKKASEEGLKTVKESDFTDLRKKLEKEYLGIIPAGAISSSLGNLLQGGLTDVKQVEQTFRRMADISAKGKSNFITMGSAVDQLAEQFRNERGALGETAGLTQEYISEILPRGLAIMQARGELQGKNVDNLTQEERAQAKLTGLLELTRDKQGGYNEQLEAGLLETEKLTGAGEKLNETFGEALNPTINALAKVFTPLVQSLTDWVTKNPEIVTAVTILAGVVTLLGAAFLLLSSPIGLFVAAGVGIIGVFALLGTELSKNEEFVKSAKKAWEAIQKSFTEAVNYVTEQLKPVFEDISKNVMPVLEKTFKSFTDLLPLLLEYLKPVAKFFTDVFVIAIETVVTVFKGLVKFIGGFFDLLIGLFTGNGDKIKEGFLNMFGGIGDAVGGIFKGIFNVIIKIINDGISNINKLIQQIPDNVFSTFGKNKNDFKIPEIPKFAGGADFNGGNAGIDKNLVSFWANRDERIIVQTPAQQNDNSSYSNTTNYNNYGSTPMFLSSAF